MKTPAFQYYPRDLLCDANVMAMSLEELGAYWKLVSVCWLEMGLPGTETGLARLLRVSPAKFRKLWPALERCFVLDEHGRYQHPRLNRERAKQDGYRDAKSRAGASGGKAKALANGWQTPSKQLAKPSSSSASATTYKKELGRDKPAPDPRVRSLGSFFNDLHVERFRTKAHFTKGKDGRLLKGLLAERDEAEIQALMRGFFDSRDLFIARAGYTIGVFVSQVGKLLPKVAGVIHPDTSKPDWWDEAMAAAQAREKVSA